MTMVEKFVEVVGDARGQLPDELQLLLSGAAGSRP